MFDMIVAVNEEVNCWTTLLRADLANSCQGTLLWLCWMDRPTDDEYSNCSTKFGKNVWFVSLCSPRKVAASPTTQQFLSPTAQRSSFSSFFTNTVSFTLPAYRRGLFQSSCHFYGLVIRHNSIWLISLTASPQKSLTQKSSSGRTAHQTSSSMSSLGTEFTCLAYM